MKSRTHIHFSASFSRSFSGGGSDSVLHEVILATVDVNHPWRPRQSHVVRFGLPDRFMIPDDFLDEDRTILTTWHRIVPDLAVALLNYEDEMWRSAQDEMRR